MTARKAAKKSAKKLTKRRAAKRSAAKTAAKGNGKKPPQSMPYEQGKWAAQFTRQAGERRNWLVKSELGVFSFDDLLAAKDGTTRWDGIRNTAARNFLRDAMKRGDRVFFYHSNAEPSAIVGICEVVKEGYPDPSAFDRTSAYFDSESDRAMPMWYVVDVRAIEKLKHPVTLPAIKSKPALQDMALVRVGRLAVTPVTDAEWDTVIAMSEAS